MVQNLEGMGFTVVPFGQGFKDMFPQFAVEIIQVLLPTITERTCSYKKRSSCFLRKSPITVYLFEFLIPSISRPP